MTTDVGRDAIGGVFDTRGVTRGPDGTKRYDGLPTDLVTMLRAVRDRTPDAEAVAETGGGPRLTYRELWDRAAAAAGGLAAAGVGRGDRTAVRLDNGVDWVLAFLGSVMAGAIVVPVNTRLAEDEVAYVLADSGASHVFTPGNPCRTVIPSSSVGSRRPIRSRSSTPAARPASRRASSPPTRTCSRTPRRSGAACTSIPSAPAR